MCIYSNSFIASREIPYSASCVDISGTCPSSEKEFSIIFHVLVPKTAWKWSDNNFVGIRIDHEKLGSWIKSVGDFHIVRYLCNKCTRCFILCIHT